MKLAKKGIALIVLLCCTQAYCSAPPPQEEPTLKEALSEATRFYFRIQNQRFAITKQEAQILATVPHIGDLLEEGVSEQFYDHDNRLFSYDFDFILREIPFREDISDVDIRQFIYAVQNERFPETPPEGAEPQHGQLAPPTPEQLINITLLANFLGAEGTADLCAQKLNELLTQQAIEEYFKGENNFIVQMIKKLPQDFLAYQLKTDCYVQAKVRFTFSLFPFPIIPATVWGQGLILVKDRNKTTGLMNLNTLDVMELSEVSNKWSNPLPLSGRRLATIEFHRPSNTYRLKICSIDSEECQEKILEHHPQIHYRKFKIFLISPTLLCVRPEKGGNRFFVKSAETAETIGIFEYPNHKLRDVVRVGDNIIAAYSSINGDGGIISVWPLSLLEHAPEDKIFRIPPKTISLPDPLDTLYLFKLLPVGNDKFLFTREYFAARGLPKTIHLWDLETDRQDFFSGEMPVVLSAEKFAHIEGEKTLVVRASRPGGPEITRFGLPFRPNRMRSIPDNDGQLIIQSKNEPTIWSLKKKRPVCSSFPKSFGMNPSSVENNLFVSDYLVWRVFENLSFKLRLALTLINRHLDRQPRKLNPVRPDQYPLLYETLKVLGPDDEVIQTLINYKRIVPPEYWSMPLTQEILSIKGKTVQEINQKFASVCDQILSSDYPSHHEKLLIFARKKRDLALEWLIDHSKKTLNRLEASIARIDEIPLPEMETVQKQLHPLIKHNEHNARELELIQQIEDSQARQPALELQQRTEEATQRARWILSKAGINQKTITWWEAQLNAIFNAPGLFVLDTEKERVDRELQELKQKPIWQELTTATQAQLTQEEIEKTYRDARRTLFFDED